MRWTVSPLIERVVRGEALRDVAIDIRISES